MNPVEVIRKKRDGETLTEAEIRSFITGIVNGSIPTYQATAFLMATYFNGMRADETATLTRCMIESGSRVSFKNEPKAVRFVDKHSTGGVGDKVSLMLAPLAAALGLKVPMVAGRGLGHTGGTLDKLESIPGYSVNLSLSQFESQVKSLGCAIMGQTKDFVPADKTLYALRDVTATVECIPLITASILSKKVAEGITGLVLDIKVGSGAFMKTLNEAQALAKSLILVGKELGLSMRAVLTDMNQPLGACVGNSLEVLECLQIMGADISATGVSLPSPLLQDIKDVTIELCAHMLVVGEKSHSLSAARLLARKALSDGTALAKFKDMCKAQGATLDVADLPNALPVSNHYVDIKSLRAGYVIRIDGEAIGKAVVDLGGGRHAAEDTVDFSVGLVLTAKTGATVKKGSDLARLYYNPERLRAKGLSVESMIERFQEAFSIGPRKPAAIKQIRKVMT